ncbi:MAG TPA: CRISPR system precrRNA processing endoribonuclease RAMP protein Cas6 [Candidatus Fimousia stercorigallinarum]|nr:CRISPR system precrRNA processing endoribonuclease RAMP protein Cas6 [Candidatus Fimousia stercorigallinarum]
MFDIPYIKLHFYTELMADTVMPETKVAALRGGMGEMLLRQNCIADKNCHKCHFYESCIVQHTFYSVMEKKPAYVTGDESVGYLIECMDRRTKYKKGSRFEFFLTLFGESIVFFNSYLQAFHQLGMAGIGKHHSRFRICEIRNTEGELLVLGSQVDMSRYVIHTISDYILYRKETLLNMNGKWTLTFQTPLSMKHRRYFMQEFYSEALVKGAARRIQMLNYYTGTESIFPEFAEYPEIDEQRVRKEAVRRYSGTHNSHITLHGISGKVVFQNMPEECLDYLIAGELTHMGRNTSFGFGKYVLRRETAL